MWTAPWLRCSSGLLGWRCASSEVEVGKHGFGGPSWSPAMSLGSCDWTSTRKGRRGRKVEGASFKSSRAEFSCWAFRSIHERERAPHRTFLPRRHLPCDLCSFCRSALSFRLSSRASLVVSEGLPLSLLTLLHPITKSHTEAQAQTCPVEFSTQTSRRGCAHCEDTEKRMAGPLILSV